MRQIFLKGLGQCVILENSNIKSKCIHDEECAICLDAQCDYLTICTVNTQLSGHTYHEQCLFDHYKHGGTQCPLDRKEIKMGYSLITKNFEYFSDFITRMRPIPQIPKPYSLPYDELINYRDPNGNAINGWIKIAPNQIVAQFKEGGRGLGYYWDDNGIQVYRDDNPLPFYMLGSFTRE